MIKTKTGHLPDSNFENDLDFDVTKSNRKYSKESLEKTEKLAEKLKEEQSKK